MYVCRLFFYKELTWDLVKSQVVKANFISRKSQNMRELREQYTINSN